MKNEMLDVSKWPEGVFGWSLDMTGEFTFERSKTELKFSNYDEGKAEGGKLSIPINCDLVDVQDFQRKRFYMGGPHGVSAWNYLKVNSELAFEDIMRFLVEQWRGANGPYCGTWEDAQRVQKDIKSPSEALDVVLAGDKRGLEIWLILGAEEWRKFV